jgi:hypothetical protein
MVPQAGSSTPPWPLHGDEDQSACSGHNCSDSPPGNLLGDGCRDQGSREGALGDETC